MRDTDFAFELWKLPEVLVHKIVTFAAGPTHRAHVLCHQIALLSRDSCKAILEDKLSASLWDAILKEDYGVTHLDDDKSTRRSSKRLKRSSPQRVQEAHRLLCDNTEIAFFYLGEMTQSPTQSLSHSRLCGLIDEYGPHLRVSNVTSTGGTFLVECCRARHVKERTILRCVQELVERQGASVNGSTNESAKSSMTPLCVAAARGIPLVLKYLLSQGASTEIKGSGRFRLQTQRRKTVRCFNATPLEFSKSMLDAERAEGANDGDLEDLNKCIRLLQMRSEAHSEC